MNIQSYLNRIQYTKQPRVCHEVLAELHFQHLLHIPFENLDIHYNVPIVLDPRNFYRKIVAGGRGGFCYELNGLFGELLKGLGFNCKLVSARVYETQERYSPEYDHLAIVVRIGNSDILADVGFGDFFLLPKQLDVPDEQVDATGEYVIDRHDSEFIRVNKRIGTQLEPQYIFRNRAAPLPEFQDRCDFHQSSPNSHFSKKKLVSIVTTTGRITLTDDLLITTSDHQRHETPFPASEFEAQLKTVFNIEID